MDWSTCTIRRLWRSKRFFAHEPRGRAALPRPEGPSEWLSYPKIWYWYIDPVWDFLWLMLKSLFSLLGMDFSGTKIAIFEPLPEYFSRVGRLSGHSTASFLHDGEEKRGDHCARRFGKVTSMVAVAWFWKSRFMIFALILKHDFH